MQAPHTCSKTATRGEDDRRAICVVKARTMEKCWKMSAPRVNSLPPRRSCSALSCRGSGGQPPAARRDQIYYMRKPTAQIVSHNPTKDLCANQYSYTCSGVCVAVKRG